MGLLHEVELIFVYTFKKIDQFYPRNFITAKFMQIEHGRLCNKMPYTGDKKYPVHSLTYPKFVEFTTEVGNGKLSTPSSLKTKYLKKQKLS